MLLDAYVCNLLHYDCSEVPYIGMAEALGAGSADLTNIQVAVCDQCHTANMDLTEERTETEKSSGTGKLSGEACDESVQLRFLSGDEIWDEEIPYAQKVVAVRDVVEEVESCSACYGSLLPVLDRLKEEGLLEALQEKSVSDRDTAARAVSLASEFARPDLHTASKDVRRQKRKFMRG